MKPDTIIHELSDEEVFQTIAEAGQEPHWAYKAGMRRLSCVFCIMACGADLKTAAQLNPAKYAEYVALEQVIDQTFVMPNKTHGRRFLPDVTGVEPDINLVQMHIERLGGVGARAAA